MSRTNFARRYFHTISFSFPSPCIHPWTDLRVCSQSVALTHSSGLNWSVRQTMNSTFTSPTNYCRVYTHTHTHTTHRSPTRTGPCTLNAVGLLPVSRAWRCEGRPPLPHHLVCVETFTLPYLRRLIYSSRTNGGGFDPCRAPTMSHEVYGASLVATIASHVQGTWIVRIRRAQSLESGLHSTEAWRPATCSCRPEGVR